ncbi:diacylglycerol/lipid kinase family protein [Pseudonocardia broussonetiae]|nr:diacylglycerol kinase family protein [Pseudonocardia broussonetiae]
MSASGATWVVVVLLAVLLFGVVLTLTMRNTRSRPGAELFAADPEDRPLAAVVANPTKIDPGTHESIAALCVELGWAEPLWLETTIEDPGTGQAEKAVEQGVDVVMACGGDGTVRSVAQALAGTGVAMGLLPAGTGNLLARTLGTPLEMDAATRVALTGDDRTIDIGRVRVDGADEERAFLVMAGTGFDAEVMGNTPEALKARVGPLAYVVSGLRAIRGRRTRVTIRLDDGPELRRRTRTVLVGNSGTLLGGLVLMPEAEVDDGLFDIVNLAPKGVAGWVAVAARVISRRRRGHPRVEHWTAERVVITADDPQASQIDGDPIGDVTEMAVRVDPGALVVRVPEGSPAAEILPES